MKGTSGSPSTTTRTRPRRTGAIPISSRSVSSRRRSRTRRRRTPMTSSPRSPRAAQRMENAARKVERTMRKVGGRDAVEQRVGDTFDAIVTGVNQSGTFARLTHPPAEGRLMRGEHGVDVGDRVRVKLIGVDVAKGFIDFARE